MRWRIEAEARAELEAAVAGIVEAARQGLGTEFLMSSRAASVRLQRRRMLGVRWATVCAASDCADFRMASSSGSRGRSRRDHDHRRGAPAPPAGLLAQASGPLFRRPHRVSDALPCWTTSATRSRRAAGGPQMEDGHLVRQRRAPSPEHEVLRPGVRIGGEVGNDDARCALVAQPDRPLARTAPASPVSPSSFQAQAESRRATLWVRSAAVVDKCGNLSSRSTS